MRNRLIALGLAGFLAIVLGAPSEALSRGSAADTCFTCQIAPQECGGDYHRNWIASGSSDIWQDNFHHINWCIEGNCSSHHSWYYDCGGGEEECGGGLCFPDTSSVASPEEFERAVIEFATARPERLFADVERNLVRGIGCNGAIAVTIPVSRQTARKVAELTAPELIFD